MARVIHLPAMTIWEVDRGDFPDLPDGDKIEYTPVDAPDVAPHRLKLTLVKEATVDWWKGIQVLNGRGHVVAEVGAEGPTELIRSLEVEAADAAFVYIMKARDLGQHKWVYLMADDGWTQLGGKSVTFRWVKQ